MATYSKPAKIPRWSDSLSNVLEPSEGKKDDGWAFQEIPPSAFENWRTQLNGQWWKWLDERLQDGVTNDVLQTTMPLSIDGRDDFVLQVIGNDARIDFKGLSGNTYIRHDQANDHMEFYVGGVEQLRLTPTQAIINADIEIGDDLTIAGGLRVGFSGSPTDDRIELGDAAFYLDFDATDPHLVFDTAGGNIDEILYDRSSNYFDFKVAGTTEVRITTDGLRVLNGIYVGSTGSTATDNKIYAQGDIEAGVNIIAGGTIDATGDGTFGSITMTNFSVNGTGDIDANSLAVGSGNATISTAGSIVCTGLEAGAGVVNATGMDAGNGGITNAGAISGATSVACTSLSAGAGAIDCGSLDVSNGGITNAGAIGAAAITCTSLSAGAGAIDCGSLDVSSGGITNAGAIGAAAITCTSLSAGAGAIDCGSLDVSSGGITNAGAIGAAAITCTSLDAGAGTVQTTGLGDFGTLNVGTSFAVSAGGDLSNVGDISGTGNWYCTGRIGHDSNDYIDWSNDAYTSFVVNAVEEMRIGTAGLNIRDGVHIGNIATAPPAAGELYCDSYLSAKNVTARENLVFDNAQSQSAFGDGHITVSTGNTLVRRPICIGVKNVGANTAVQGSIMCLVDQTADECHVQMSTTAGDLTALGVVWDTQIVAGGTGRLAVLGPATVLTRQAIVPGRHVGAWNPLGVGAWWSGTSYTVLGPILRNPNTTATVESRIFLTGPHIAQ